MVSQGTQRCRLTHRSVPLQDRLSIYRSYCQQMATQKWMGDLMSASAAKVQAETSDRLPERTPKRAALASWIGSALEYYDFAVYVTASASVLYSLFYPASTHRAVSVLLAMGTVGIAYVVRPYGAVVMGSLADKLG